MSVRYAGDSYSYLLHSVTTAHGRSGTSPMTRYYAAEGTPPGTWLGTGLRGLADGAGLAAGSSVTPMHMERLFRDGKDPVVGAHLGRSPHVYPEGELSRRRPVAGFDATFTVPKTVSVLWALADEATRETIYACHRRAVDDVLTVIERDVARTRIGTNGVAQVDVRGVIAAAFDHWDSRDNDPNLHTHVVIANRAQGPDGRWRTLDSRAMHKAAVAMSERYDALLADHLTAALGLEWEYRERGAGRNPSYDLACVPKPLVEAFSQRSAAIDTETDRLVSAYAAAHGHRPDHVTILKLRQQANLATRNPKQAHSLADLTDDWLIRASGVIEEDPREWAASAVQVRLGTPTLTSPTPIAPSEVAEAADAVLAVVSRKRSTWTSWNVDAEASRALKAHRFQTVQARDEATAAVAEDVAARSVLLTPPETAPVPAGLRRTDGSSAFRHHRAERYTSQQTLDAERRLLTAGRDVNGPTLATAPAPGGLHDDQVAAVAAIGASGRVVDVLVGPAGSGKTRSLAALRTAWEAEHGLGSVRGLAPSAAAADVLSSHLGITCENTAKWLVEHEAEPGRLAQIDRTRRAVYAVPDAKTAARLTAYLERQVARVDAWRFQPGQLVILDEASLAGTLDLDRIAACVGEAGAKLLLVGDWAQLSAVEAGGGFALLVRDRRAGVPELGAARRFTHEWEREASTRLRVGDVDVLEEYAAHDRLREGDHDAMVDEAYASWAADAHAGKLSLLIASDRATVRALNERARADLTAAGLVAADGTALHDGLAAGVGDRIVTRRNIREISLGRGWVKNGDSWTVTARGDDGSMSVTRPGGGPEVVLPAAYVARYVELGYATTAFRAQGSTVDTGHAIVTGAGLTREVLYVMLTRARETNRAYVCTDRKAEPLAGFADLPMTGHGVLAAVLEHVGAATSAHEVANQEVETAASIRTLAAEYETIAHHAQAPHWVDLLLDAGLTPAQVRAVTDSPAFGALGVALGRAEAHQLPLGTALPKLIHRAENGADDLAAVLHRRVDDWTSLALAAGRGRPCRLVGGLFPAVSGVPNPEIARALAAREALIDSCADVVMARA